MRGICRMKRTYFCFFLVLIFTCSFTAHAETASGTFSQLQALIESAYGKTGNENVVKLDRDYIAASGELHIVIKQNKSVVIDLNGHSIDRNLSAAAAGGNVIYIESGATLTVRDSGGTGTITGGNNKTTNYTSPGCAGGVHIYYGTFNFEGGTICGNKTTQKTGGGIYNCGGELVMSGNSSVSDNTASSYAGGIEGYSNSTTIMKDNSKVTGNKAKYGGGIDVDGTSTFTMQDNAIISGNEGTSSGGGCIVEGSAKLILKDNATIKDNRSPVGGGVRYIGKSTLIVGGSAKITGNTSSNGANNVNLASGKLITIGEGENAPTAAMTIGVNTDVAPTVTAPVAVTDANNTDYRSAFIPDKENIASLYDSDTKKVLLVTGCKVTFLVDGEEISSVTNARNKPITEFPKVSRKGYEFFGWYKDPSYTELWDASADVVTEKTELYGYTVLIPVPKTGDSDNPFVYLVMMLTGLCAMIAMRPFRRRQN